MLRSRSIVLKTALSFRSVSFPVLIFLFFLSARAFPGLIPIRVCFYFWPFWFGCGLVCFCSFSVYIYIFPSILSQVLFTGRFIIMSVLCSFFFLLVSLLLFFPHLCSLSFPSFCLSVGLMCVCVCVYACVRAYVVIEASRHFICCLWVFSLCCAFLLPTHSMHCDHRKPAVPFLSCAVSELRSCVKVEVDVLGSPSLNSPYGRCGRQTTLKNRAQELCESRGGRPRSPYGLCGFKATLT